MFIRALTAALSLPFVLLSLLGTTPTARAAEPSFVYCKEDIGRLCPGVLPGGGRIIRCLKQHENEVSVGCAKEIKAIKTKMGR